MKLFLLLLCGCSLVLPKNSNAQNRYADSINRYMQAQALVNEFSGAVLVTLKGQPIYQKSFGYADREWKISTTTETKFEIGSLTKQFTAAAILQLADSKKLNLNDKLSGWFADYPKGDSVTIHMLLNHTSGIVDYTSLSDFFPLHTLALPKDSIISLFKNKPYIFPPGTKWSYSNSNYFLLGCIIEKISGKSFAAYLNENVIKKAGLLNTAVNNLDSILTFRAKGYSKTAIGTWKNAPYFSMEFPFSAGSLISTADDLNKWQHSLLNGEIMSSEMLRQMTTPYLNDYGYGLFIDSFNHHLRIAHAGAIPGFTSHLTIFPSEQMAIVVLSNNDGNSDEIANEIAAALFHLPVKMPYKPVETNIDISVLDQYTGKYQLGGTTNFEILKKDNYLFLQPQGGGPMKLIPESETKFFFQPNPEQQIEFIVDKNGKILKCFFINKGNQTEIKRQ